MSNILLVGNGAREHALAEAILRSSQTPRLFSFMKANNPGIASLSEKIKSGSYSDLETITGFAKDNKIELAVIGPEDPLNNGVVDALAIAAFRQSDPLRACPGWKHPNLLPVISSVNIIFPAIRSSKYLK